MGKAGAMGSKTGPRATVTSRLGNHHLDGQGWANGKQNGATGKGTCIMFMRQGSCAWGDGCKFDHDRREGDGKARPDQGAGKKEICHRFAKEGTC